MLQSLKRAIEGDSSAKAVHSPFRMTVAGVIDINLRQVRVSKAADPCLQQISTSIGQTPLRAFNALRVQDWTAKRQAFGLKASSIVRHFGRLSQVLHWARHKDRARPLR